MTVCNKRGYSLHLGDSAEVLKSLPQNSVDSLVTDPPAGIGLLNLEWDKNRGGRDEWVSWLSQILGECLRVMKPGAHGLVWAYPRTSHWTAMACEAAGFEIRDVIHHVFATGFPKNTAVDQAIDRARVTDTDLLYRATRWIRERRDELGLRNADLERAAGCAGACHWTARPPRGSPVIPPLERWLRLETILGPAPDWLRPLIRPSREAGEAWRTREVVGVHARPGGGLTGKRFGPREGALITRSTNPEALKWSGWGTALKPAHEHWILVRKPLTSHNLAANVVKNGTGAINIDATRLESGKFPSNFLVTNADPTGERPNGLPEKPYFQIFPKPDPFFFSAKPSRRERGSTNRHPTVKPLALMSYLTRLVTPAGGTVLDPFMGSGTTGVAARTEGFEFIGIERELPYFLVAYNRLARSSRG